MRRGVEAAAGQRGETLGWDALREDGLEEDVLIADHLRFLGIAAGSGGELETQLLVSERLASLTSDQARELLDGYREVERRLAGLVRSLDRS